MANNRMYLICVPCQATSLNADDDRAPDFTFYVAKYYPSTGWYSPRAHLDEDLDAFFDAHQHGSLTGQDFTLVYGDQLTRATQPILSAITDAICHGQETAYD